MFIVNKILLAAIGLAFAFLICIGQGPAKTSSPEHSYQDKQKVFKAKGELAQGGEHKVHNRW